MRFENPRPDETVNYSTEHPLKEFVWLLAGVSAIVAAAVALTGYFAGELAAWVPFRVEKEYADGITRHWESNACRPRPPRRRPRCALSGRGSHQSCSCPGAWT